MREKVGAKVGVVEEEQNDVKADNEEAHLGPLLDGTLHV